MAVVLPNYPEFSEDPRVAQRWSNWIEGFEALVRAMQINKQVKEDKDKYALLFHYVGQQTRNILKKLEDNGCADEGYKKAKAALEGHFKPKMNSVYLMHVVHQCRQGSSETIFTCELGWCHTLPDRVKRTFNV